VTTCAHLAGLDSLSYALDGGLDAWLSTGRGAELSLRERLWLPKVSPEVHGLVEQILACVRRDARAAIRDADQWLDGDQRHALARLAHDVPAVAALRRATGEAWAWAHADATNISPRPVPSGGDALAR
jgi:hypothetical protein